MAGYTAQVIVGNAPHSGEGILPLHTLSLSENGRAAWILRETTMEQAPVSAPTPWTWIPSAVENILEDGILMIANYLLKDEVVVAALSPIIGKLPRQQAVELPDLVELRELQRLHCHCRGLGTGGKTVWTLMEGSSIRGQLHKLRYYCMDMEVCLPIYSWLYNQWQDKIEIRGELPAGPNN